MNATLTVTEGLEAYLKENGFSVAAYDAPTALVEPFGLRLHIPNTAARKWAIRRHDLHHVATGYATDLAGEAEISAWELSRGLKGLGLYVRLIILSAALIGFVFWPRRTWRAFRAAPRGGSLFTEAKLEPLLALSVCGLRERLALPPDGIANSSERTGLSSPAV